METGETCFGHDSEKILVFSQAPIGEQIKLLDTNDYKVFPVFFTTNTGGSFPRNNPRELKAELLRKITLHSDIEEIRITRNGNLLCVARSASCAAELLKVKKLLLVDITGKLQLDGLTTRFLLHNIHTELSLIELAQELEASNNLKVKEIRRFVKRGTSAQQLTETVLVTIFGTRLPSEVSTWYLRHKINLFTDRPRQCGKCFKYDHSTAVCKKEQICEICSEKHAATSCVSQTSKCVNCNESHKATDKTCKAWAKEAQILVFKANNHLSLAEARRKFRLENATQYSAIVKSHCTTAKSSEDLLEIKQLIKESEEKTKFLIGQALNEQAKMFESLLTKFVTTINHSFQQMLSSIINMQLTTSEQSPPPGKKKKSQQEKTLKLASAGRPASSNFNMEITPENDDEGNLVVYANA